jgi:hypothetical protein
MKAIITKQSSNGTYDEVGMNNRALFSHYKTERGVIRYGVPAFANGRPCRVEFFHNIYGQPYRTVYTVSAEVTA